MAAIKRNTTPRPQPEPHALVGRRIVAVRGNRTNVALILDDGSALVPSRDEECNGPGVLLQHSGVGVSIVLA